MPTYERVFGTSEESAYDLPEQSAAPTARAPVQSGRAADASPAAAAPPEPLESPRPSRAELWTEQRALASKAMDLGIRVPTLNQRVADDMIAESNASLREQIHAAESQITQQEGFAL